MRGYVRPSALLRRSVLIIAIGLLSMATVACASAAPEKAADFTIATYQDGGVLEGGVTSLQAVLDQGKPVVLNFWAGDCPPCTSEMPTLEAAWQESKEDFVLLAIDIGPFMRLGTYAQGVARLQDLGVTYPAGNTPDSNVLEDFNLTGLPTTFFMTPDGSIVESWPGSITSGPLRSKIKNVIDETANRAS